MVRKSRQVRAENRLQERKRKAMAEGKPPPPPPPTFRERLIETVEWGMVFFVFCMGVVAGTLMTCAIL